jgi:nucleotide-binding universal stress UspA family protein
MKTYKTILFPIELTGISTKIAPHVVAMAAYLGARVHVIHVVQGFVVCEGSYIPRSYLEDFEGKVMAEAREKLSEFTAQHLGELASLTTALVTGDTADEILAYAEGHGVDLIILGTHGRRGLEGTIFGGVARRIIHRSPLPVLVINPYRTKS